jgi:hypothetical protein
MKRPTAHLRAAHAARSAPTAGDIIDERPGEKPLTEFDFATEPEVRAFIEGVQYLNEQCIVVGFAVEQRAPRRWVVTVVRASDEPNANGGAQSERLTLGIAAPRTARRGPLVGRG